VLHSIRQEKSPSSQSSEKMKYKIENSVSEASTNRSRNNEFEINLMMKFHHSAHVHPDLKNPYREGFRQLFLCKNENFELLGILLLYYQSAGLNEKNCTASSMSTFDALDGLDGGEEGDGAGAEWGDVSGGKAEKETIECHTNMGHMEGTGGETNGENGIDWGNEASKNGRNGHGPWTGGVGVGIYYPGFILTGPVLELPGVNAVMVLRAMGVLPLRSDARTDTDTHCSALGQGQGVSSLSGLDELKGEGMVEEKGEPQGGGELRPLRLSPVPSQLVDEEGGGGPVREGSECGMLGTSSSQGVVCVLEGHGCRDGDRDVEGGRVGERDMSCKTDVTSDSSPLSDMSPTSPHPSRLHPTADTTPGSSVPLPLSLAHSLSSTLPSLPSLSLSPTVSLPLSSTPSSSCIPPPAPSSSTTSTSSYPTLCGVKWVEEIEEEARVNMADERSPPLPPTLDPAQGPIWGNPEGGCLPDMDGCGSWTGGDDTDNNNNSNEGILNQSTPNPKDMNYMMKMHTSNMKIKGAVQVITEEMDDIENPSEEQGLSSLEPDVMSVYKLISISEYFYDEILQYGNKSDSVMVRNTRIGMNKYDTKKDQFDDKNGTTNTSEVENQNQTEVENIFANCIGNNCFVDMDVDTDLENTVSDMVAVTPKHHTVEYGKGGEGLSDSRREQIQSNNGVEGGDTIEIAGRRETKWKEGREGQGQGEGQGQSSSEGASSGQCPDLTDTSTINISTVDKHSNSNSDSDSSAVTPTLLHPASLPLSQPSSLHLSLPLSPSSPSSSSLFDTSICDDIVFSMLQHSTRHSMVCMQVTSSTVTVKSFKSVKHSSFVIFTTYFIQIILIFIFSIQLLFSSRFPLSSRHVLIISIILLILYFLLSPGRYAHCVLVREHGTDSHRRAG
jgi:hypothetical protein